MLSVSAAMHAAWHSSPSELLCSSALLLAVYVLIIAGLTFPAYLLLGRPILLSASSTKAVGTSHLCCQGEPSLLPCKLVHEGHAARAGYENLFVVVEEAALIAVEERTSVRDMLMRLYIHRQERLPSLCGSLHCPLSCIA